MSIRNFNYNKKQDLIEGFQDHVAQGRSPIVASYALVFMIAGIRKKVKQPIIFLAVFLLLIACCTDKREQWKKNFMKNPSQRSSHHVGLYASFKRVHTVTPPNRSAHKVDSYSSPTRRENKQRIQATITAARGSLEKVAEFTRKSLCDIMCQCTEKTLGKKLSFLEEKLFVITKCPKNQSKILTRALRYFKNEYKRRWIAASYTSERFLRLNEEWLNSSIVLPSWSSQQENQAGRPNKSFQELCDRSKRRKTSDLREQVSVEELTFAAGVSQRTSGNNDASKIIREITYSPARAKKLRRFIASGRKPTSVEKHTPEKALAIFVEGDFSRRQYEILHGANKNVYPCYSLIQKEKKKSYPIESSIHVTETSSEIQLQELLDHTTLRLYEHLEEVIETLSDEDKQNMALLSKWGCDGSQQSQFKQKFRNSTDSDENIFQSSFVPLRLVVMNHEEQKKIVWQNPTPSSVRFCRPIRIVFVKESVDVTKNEIAHINNQLKSLRATEVSLPNGICKIKHNMMLTMVDGKVCNAATDTASTMRCYICKQTSKDFNKLIDTDEINVDALKFGLSVLHARIRFFEFLLHLAYKLPLKKWQARTAEDKIIIKERKTSIQNAFKEEMGLLVDIPKQGFGNTNDGNTSRRFFSNPECSSRITGIDIELIKRFRMILEVISSGHSIDAEKFDVFARETANMYTNLYDWHPMSPTIHKILVHGAKVISNAILPIGQLSEEAAEARNKYIRQYRLNFARKFSRVDCNRDILNRLLLSSDPYLSCNRPKNHKKSIPFSPEALNLMVSSFLEEESDKDEAVDECEHDVEADDQEPFSN
ncbi:hypothetical protein ACJJTC_007165 [Scirpophaga incertulas]